MEITCSANKVEDNPKNCPSLFKGCQELLATVIFNLSEQIVAFENR